MSTATQLQGRYGTFEVYIGSLGFWNSAQTEHCEMVSLISLLIPGQKTKSWAFLKHDSMPRRLEWLVWSSWEWWYVGVWTNCHYAERFHPSSSSNIYLESVSGFSVQAILPTWWFSASGELYPGVLTIYTGKPEIPVGKSNGLCHSVWKASKNMGCNMRWFYFSALWSLCSWCGYIL